MSTHIFINGKPVHHPLARFAIALCAIAAAALLTGVLVFILLPLAGTAITLSGGFVLIFVVAVSIGMAAMLLSSALLGWLLDIFNYRNR